MVIPVDNEDFSDNEDPLDFADLSDDEYNNLEFAEFDRINSKDGTRSAASGLQPVVVVNC